MPLKRTRAARSFGFNLIMILVLSLLAGLESSASQMRIVGNFGFGNSGAEKEGVVRTEDPFALNFAVEYTLTPRWVFGVEHGRSFEGGKSNISITGLSGRWYPWQPLAQRGLAERDEIKTSQILSRGYSGYVGFSSGFGQSSLERRTSSGRDVSVSQIYLGGKVGVESGIKGPWGYRLELNWNEGFVGEGTLRLVHLLGGIYYYL